MKRKIILSSMLVVLAVLAAVPAFAGRGGRAGSTVRVYVASQNLVYESVVNSALPPNGPFQKLETMTGPTGLQTQFGPGDPGYLGGRWWVDVNGNGMQDSGDAFFSCPLLGPGEVL